MAKRKKKRKGAIYRVRPSRVPDFRPKRISLIDFDDEPAPSVDTSWKGKGKGIEVLDWPPASRVVPQNGWEFTDRHPKHAGAWVLAKDGVVLKPNSEVTVLEAAEIRGVPRSAIYKQLAKGKWVSAAVRSHAPDWVPMWTIKAWEILYWRVVRKGDRKEEWKMIAGTTVSQSSPADTHEDSIDDD